MPSLFHVKHLAATNILLRTFPPSWRQVHNGTNRTSLQGPLITNIVVPSSLGPYISSSAAPDQGYGICPWLRGDTGIADVVLCEDGAYNAQWACRLNGQGGRVLCPPNTTMCSRRACGGGKDHCCDPNVVDESMTCMHSAGRRTCPYTAIKEELTPELNATHGPWIPGMYSVCRCSPAMFASQAIADLVGTLLIRGRNQTNSKVFNLLVSLCG